MTILLQSLLRLPEIRFPVNTEKTRFVTLAPFAKSVTGGTVGAENGVDNSVFSTNQIVDFYVDRIANAGEKNLDLSINGGLYRSFRH